MRFPYIFFKIAILSGRALCDLPDFIVPGDEKYASPNSDDATVFNNGDQIRIRYQTDAPDFFIFAQHNLPVGDYLPQEVDRIRIAFPSGPDRGMFNLFSSFWA